MNSILSAVYNSVDYNCKGYALYNTDNFFLPYKNELYLVLIMERCGLLNNNQHGTYTYALYSITRKEYVNKNTELYIEIVKDFPSLRYVDNSDANVDFWKEQRLKIIIETLINKAVKEGSLTEKTLEKYLSYLSDKKKMLSKTFQELYEFFESKIRIGG